MINNLLINNFQSHKGSMLDFCPGVNVIVGESDSGKTAILRALKWILTNRPGGDSFRSNWGGSTQAVVTVQENVIIREKSQENCYWLNDLEFKAFGTDVPEEIQAVLNMNEINIQSQLDLPFLLRDSPGQVAAHFNKIAHLDAIDSSMQLVEKWTRNLAQGIKYAEGVLEQKQADLKEFDYLNAMEKDVADAEWFYQQYTAMIKKQTRLDSMLSRITDIETTISKKAPLFKLETTVNEAVILIQQLEARKEQKRKLVMTLLSIDTNEKKIQTRRVTIANEAAMEKALVMLSTVQRKQVEIRNLKKIIEHEKVVNLKIQRREHEVDAWENKFHKEIGTTCPLCGQEVK